MKLLTIFISFFSIAVFSNAKTMPAWFLRSFNAQKISRLYTIVNRTTPQFLEADFNGDKMKDVAVQVKDNKTGKLGILIINYGRNFFYVFGAGKKFAGESFDQTKWVDGWEIYYKKIAHVPLFNSDGDIVGEKNIKLNYSAIYIYKKEDGDDIAGELIYWDGAKYLSIHQGE